MFRAQRKVKLIGLRAKLQVTGWQAGVGAGEKAATKIRIAYARGIRRRVRICAGQQGFQIIGAGHILVAIAVDPLAGNHEAHLVRVQLKQRLGGRSGKEQAAGKQRACVANTGQAEDAGGEGGADPDLWRPLGAIGGTKAVYMGASSWRQVASLLRAGGGPDGWGPRPVVVVAPPADSWGPAASVWPPRSAPTVVSVGPALAELGPR